MGMHFYHQFNDLDISGIYDYEPLLPCFDFPKDMRGQQVLDLGCGSGYFARHFESKGAQVIACDVNIGAADYIKKRLDLDLSLYTILQILSVTAFERTPLSQILTQTDPKSVHGASAKQLDLFT